MRVLLATRNPDKAREIRAILPADAFDLVSLDDLNILPAPEEDRIEDVDTFRESALAKARFFARRTGLPTIADDSGLAVHALDGAPGIRSKRFSGRPDLTGPELDRANNELLLQRLGGLPPEVRGAHYTCAAALVHLDRPLLVTLGTCSGRIATEPRGHAGFGYDPLFLLPDLGITFGEAPPSLKHRRSHRARAFRALAALLGSFPPRVDGTRHPR